ncbi:GNAT family N-acetyltransferase [Aeromicrobium sp. Root472D3]|uniref:GNAT family N-acetyltransferase n=1 Tax=unclassified Aeromicrobium TaxID=2633570 RepID=UPI000AAB8405|nr:GNAT family N-acetyltransferase [Aeromicrobium sp. Root472D3]MBD8606403.1 GNAT family N-acetyltransferase [Aeromicrobium sp. CFBP 8757]
MSAARPATVVLADGRHAVVRTLVASDRAALEQLFARTSEQNLYTRFFGLGASTVPRHLDHLFSGSPSVTAYVLTRDDRVLGVADVERLDPSSAEVAFLVADDAHGCGVATLLLERAAADARAAGVAWFVADVLATNHPMLQVFEDAGFAVHVRRDGTEVSVRMSTALDTGARDASVEHAAASEAARRARDLEGLS